MYLTLSLTYLSGFFREENEYIILIFSLISIFLCCLIMGLFKILNISTIVGIFFIVGILNIFSWSHIMFFYEKKNITINDYPMIHVCLFIDIFLLYVALIIKQKKTEDE